MYHTADLTIYDLKYCCVVDYYITIKSIYIGNQYILFHENYNVMSIVCK